MYKKNMGEVILDFAKNMGYTQKQLADAINVSQGSISEWKKNVPSSTNLVKVADLLGVSIDKLIGRDDGDVAITTANSINNSNVIQNNHGQVTAYTEKDLSKQELEFIRIFRQLNGRQQFDLMALVYGFDIVRPDKVIDE